MGLKVYDALRVAEEERKKRTEGKETIKPAKEKRKYGSVRKALKKAEEERAKRQAKAETASIKVPEGFEAGTYRLGSMPVNRKPQEVISGVLMNFGFDSEDNRRLVDMAMKEHPDLPPIFERDSEVQFDFDGQGRLLEFRYEPLLVDSSRDTSALRKKISHGETAPSPLSLGREEADGPPEAPPPKEEDGGEKGSGGNKEIWSATLKAGYETITSVFGVKFAGDLMLAARKKGSIYEFIKDKSDKKAIEKAFNDLNRSVQTISVQEMPTTDPLLGNEGFKERTKERFLERLETYRQKIENANIPDEKKKELFEQFRQILEEHRSGYERSLEIGDKRVPGALGEAADLRYNLAKERDEKIEAVLNNFLHTKAKGIRIAKDALNTSLVAGGFGALRGIVYGLSAAAERGAKAYDRFSKEQQEGAVGEGKLARLKYILKDLTINATRETWQGLRLKEGKTKKERSINFIQSVGVLLRGAGIGGSAYRAFMEDGVLNEEMIDKMLDKVEKDGIAETVKNNFIDNARRVFFMEPRETGGTVRGVEADVPDEPHPEGSGRETKPEIPKTPPSETRPEFTPPKPEDVKYPETLPKSRVVTAGSFPESLSKSDVRIEQSYPKPEEMYRNMTPEQVTQMQESLKAHMVGSEPAAEAPPVIEQVPEEAAALSSEDAAELPVKTPEPVEVIEAEDAEVQSEKTPPPEDLPVVEKTGLSEKTSTTVEAETSAKAVEETQVETPPQESAEETGPLTEAPVKTSEFQPQPEADEPTVQAETPIQEPVEPSKPEASYPKPEEMYRNMTPEQVTQMKENLSARMAEGEPVLPEHIKITIDERGEGISQALQEHYEKIMGKDEAHQKMLEQLQAIAKEDHPAHEAFYKEDDLQDLVHKGDKILLDKKGNLAGFETASGQESGRLVEALNVVEGKNQIEIGEETINLPDNTSAHLVANPIDGHNNLIISSYEGDHRIIDYDGGENAYIDGRVTNVQEWMENLNGRQQASEAAVNERLSNIYEHRPKKWLGLWERSRPEEWDAIHNASGEDVHNGEFDDVRAEIKESGAKVDKVTEQNFKELQKYLHELYPAKPPDKGVTVVDSLLRGEAVKQAPPIGEYFETDRVSLVEKIPEASTESSGEYFGEKIIPGKPTMEAEWTKEFSKHKITFGDGSKMEVGSKVDAAKALAMMGMSQESLESLAGKQATSGEYFTGKTIEDHKIKIVQDPWFINGAKILLRRIK